MQIFVGGHKLVTDDKVNIDQEMFKTISQANNWSDILSNPQNESALISIRDNTNEGQPSDNGNVAGGNSAGIVFGGNDTHAIISVGWDRPLVRIAAGAGNDFKWHDDIVLKSDLDALKAKEDNIAKNLINYVPHVNLLQNSAGPFFPQADPNGAPMRQTDADAIDQWQIFPNSTVTLVKGETYTLSATTNGIFSNNHDPNNASNKCVIWIGPPISMVISGENTSANTFTWDSDTGTYPLRVNRYGKDSQVKCWNVKIEHGSQATDWTPCPLDS